MLQAQYRRLRRQSRPESKLRIIQFQMPVQSAIKQIVKYFRYSGGQQNGLVVAFIRGISGFIFDY